VKTGRADRRQKAKTETNCRDMLEKERIDSPQRFAWARIRYPENPRFGQDGEEAGDGLLIYLKPTMLGDEPVELKHYANAFTKFPHQSTADQFYDEKQFEAYRELGFYTMCSIFKQFNVHREQEISEVFKYITEKPATKPEIRPKHKSEVSPRRNWVWKRTNQ
jgi:hypothetical protein